MGGRLEEGGKGASHWEKEEEGKYVRLGHLVIFISSSGRKKSPYEGWERHACTGTSSRTWVLSVSCPFLGPQRHAG